MWFPHCSCLYRSEMEHLKNPQGNVHLIKVAAVNLRGDICFSNSFLCCKRKKRKSAQSKLMKNPGKESPWGGVSNSREKANLGPAWESWLGHSSTRFQMHKAMKMKAVLCTHGKSGRQFFQGDAVGCGPWEPSDSCKGKHASGCWNPGEMQGPSAEAAGHRDC